ncbi:DUF2093 domain-containing protein [Oryzifoliimicrobium ureilyticus]|uniref:DUF2093 domain-containing protein n=1 Tax=Oryzifoliimicrobium ureilyticus TaxID=3113724 RepID=UPI0030763AF7
MNLFEGHGHRQAQLRYLDGDFQIVAPGSFVICAVTGKQIPLDELRYWSVARQEAYVDVAASVEADRRAGALPIRKS